MNSVPSPGVLRTVILPPWLVTMPCTTASPRPVPSPTPLVVKKGSKTRSRVAASIPEPVSATDRQTIEPNSPALAEGSFTEFHQRLTVILPIPSPIAWAALVTRLTMT